MLHHLLSALLLLGLILIYTAPAQTVTGTFSYKPPVSEQQWSEGNVRTVVGIPGSYTIQGHETLLGIARDKGLGYRELRVLHPDIDPWLPPKDKELTLPLQWIISKSFKADLVINLPELRLYHLFSNNSTDLVRTYPVGIGTQEKQTPPGDFQVGQKRENPYWFIPQSLQDKYGLDVMDPGPHNPLGNFWIGLGHSSYGIHGTNNPWSVGRMATNGCIRLYPEHIQVLFEQVQPDQKVQIIYEPIKLGKISGRVYAEAHPDIYDKLDDYLGYAYQKLLDSGLDSHVDLKKYREVIRHQNGLPKDVTSD